MFVLVKEFVVAEGPESGTPTLHTEVPELSDPHLDVLHLESGLLMRQSPFPVPFHHLVDVLPEPHFILYSPDFQLFVRTTHNVDEALAHQGLGERNILDLEEILQQHIPYSYRLSPIGSLQEHLHLHQFPVQVLQVEVINSVFEGKLSGIVSFEA